ncbi:MAG: AI-2E family transporter [Actinomycetota bacterium]|nr:AI-2E family transporter [Actinomycetota bacterium]
MADERQPVPVRTILVTIGLVVATYLTLRAIVLLAHIETLLVVAAFFAVVLTPAVDLVRRGLHVSRGLAAGIVFIFGLGLVGLMLYAFIRPLVGEVREFADDLPTYVSDAREGRGTVGRLVERYNLDERLREAQASIEDRLANAGGGALRIAGRVLGGVASMVTIIVLALLMILYGPDMLRGAVSILDPPRRERVCAVAADCSRALTGYVMGNLLISVIAGTLTFVALLVFGVPFAGVLALWTAFCDLIPLVGATLGAIPTIGVAFLHSTAAGIGMLTFYIVYQQFENHVLQVVIMSKTVQINQLFVLVSVLVGVELLGIVGALLAIPAAGVIQVVARDVWDHRAGTFKEEPTIGTDETPVSEVLERADDASPEEDEQVEERERREPPLKAVE